jgi:hypothetical protein
MKNLILISIVAAFSISACGQVKVPDATKSSFSKKFPAAQSVKWGQEKEGNGKAVFEAEFKWNGKTASANFNESGDWLETEISVVKTDLPSEVTKALESQFAGYKLGEMASVETPDGKSFEIIMKKGKDKIEVILDLHGKVIKKENVKEEKEDEDKEGEK